MKQLIVLFAMIILGVSIYGMIMTDNGTSVYSSVKEVWNKQIEIQSTYP
ncbi:MAG: hypothetical protein Q4C14_08240 [Bacillota bacterium]|nr:hypothetical protein [Bacillota bacterium]